MKIGAKHHHTQKKKAKSQTKLGVCAGRIGWINANISIQSATRGLGKFQSADSPSKCKSGELVTNIGVFNSAG